MANVTAAMVKELRESTGVGMMDAKKALVEADGDFEKAVDILREKGMAKAAKKSDRIAAEGLACVYVEGNTAAVVEINSETDFVAQNKQFQDLVKDTAKLMHEKQPASMEEALAIEVEGQSLEHKFIEATQVIGEKIQFRRFEIVKKEDNEAFGPYLHMGGRIAVLTVVEGSEEVAKDIAMHVAAINPRYMTEEEVPASEVEHEKTILKEQLLNDEKNKNKPENILDKIIEGRLSKFLSEIVLMDQPFVKDGDLTVAKYLDSKGAKIKGFVRFEVGEGIEKKEDNFVEEVMSQVKG